jgi:hypothetical protein
MGQEGSIFGNGLTWTCACDRITFQLHVYQSKRPKAIASLSADLEIAQPVFPIQYLFRFIVQEYQTAYLCSCTILSAIRCDEFDFMQTSMLG